MLSVDITIAFPRQLEEYALFTEMIEKNLGQASGSLSSEISRIVTDTTLGLTFKVEPAKDVIDNKLHGKIMAYQLISW
jgi:hypothetical protein